MKDIEIALRVLRARGFSPRFAVDVGAYHGDWTVMFKGVFPECDVLMVEAQDAKEPFLKMLWRLPGVRYAIATLGARSGKLVRFAEMKTGSSVMEEQSPHPRSVVEKRTATLGGLLRGRPKPDFIKLDVQGYELEILLGAERALENAQAIQMEASLIETNKGCPLFAEVVEFMSERGFRLVDICDPIRRGDGVLWQVDLLFVKEGSKLLPDPALTRENWCF